MSRRLSYSALVSLTLITLFLVGCTDQRAPRVDNSTTQGTGTGTGVTGSFMALISSVKFNNQATTIMQMKVFNTSLFLTGTVPQTPGFGFMRWEISPNPENPTKTFAAGDNINVFSPMGSWAVQYYASGAMDITGPLAFLSGDYGLSVIDISNINVPVEVVRKPPLTPPTQTNPNPPIPSDEAYVYKAVINNPNMPRYYGFRAQDYVYTVDTSTSALTLLRKDAYLNPGQTLCCVTSAALFNNRIYVAFGDRLAMFDMAADGSLVPAGTYTDLQAAYVAATPHFLYVYHKPISTIPTSRPQAIYVFDTSGNSVNHIDTGLNLLLFAVSWDDSHIYANVDNQNVNIYRIQWGSP